jgi:hypothetical protein
VLSFGANDTESSSHIIYQLNDVAHRMLEGAKLFVKSPQDRSAAWAQLLGAVDTLAAIQWRAADPTIHISFAPELFAVLLNFAVRNETAADLERAPALWEQVEAERGRSLLTLVGRARTQHALGDGQAAMQAYADAGAMLAESGAKERELLMKLWREVREGSVRTAMVEGGSLSPLSPGPLLAALVLLTLSTAIRGQGPSVIQ